jgi:hypothetical protein
MVMNNQRIHRADTTRRVRPRRSDAPSPASRASSDRCRPPSGHVPRVDCHAIEHGMACIDRHVDEHCIIIPEVHGFGRSHQGPLYHGRRCWRWFHECADGESEGRGCAVRKLDCLCGIQCAILLDEWRKYLTNNRADLRKRLTANCGRLV